MRRKRQKAEDKKRRAVEFEKQKQREQEERKRQREQKRQEAKDKANSAQSKMRPLAKEKQEKENLARVHDTTSRKATQKGLVNTCLLLVISLPSFCSLSSFLFLLCLHLFVSQPLFQGKALAVPAPRQMQPSKSALLPSKKATASNIMSPPLSRPPSTVHIFLSCLL